MHPVVKHLEELLYAYDCVTLPGFGGFIMHYRPARLSREGGRIYPPRRTPAFNSLLRHDDGLVISRIAIQGKISYEEAALELSRFTAQCREDLAAGQAVKLGNVGELTLDDAGKLQFSPDLSSGFLPGAFGLVSLAVRPLDQEPETVALRTKRQVGRKASSTRPARKTAGTLLTLVLSIPVILVLLYGIIFPASFQATYADFTSLILAKPGGQPRATAIPPRREAVAPVVEAFSEIKPAATGDAVVSAYKEEPAPTVRPAGASLLKFYVIGGCFENHDNARKFLTGLVEKGYPAVEAGLTGRGHLRIGYQAFATRTEALQFLDIIKSTENPDAWLLKY